MTRIKIKIKKKGEEVCFERDRNLEKWVGVEWLNVVENQMNPT